MEGDSVLKWRSCGGGLGNEWWQGKLKYSVWSQATPEKPLRGVRRMNSASETGNLLKQVQCRDDVNVIYHVSYIRLGIHSQSPLRELREPLFFWISLTRIMRCQILMPTYFKFNSRYLIYSRSQCFPCLMLFKGVEQ